MSATDDAKLASAPRPPRTGRRMAAAVLAGATLGFLAAAALVQHLPPGPWPRYEVRVAWEGGPPTSGEWPRAARPGEEARCAPDGDGTLLVVRSVCGDDALELAAALQRRRLSGLDGSAARRAAVRTRWRAERLPGPEPWLSAATRSAALVRGRLLLVALLDPGAAAAPVSTPEADGARARLDAAGDEVVRLAMAAQPDSLETALTACAVAESEWLRAAAVHPAGVSRAQLEGAWGWHERSRAPVLDSVERRLEAGLSEPQLALVPALAFDRALRLERLAPDPAAILFVAGRWGGGVEPSAVVRTWVMLLGSGVLAGALAGLALAALRPRRRARPAAPRLVGGTPAARGARAAGARAQRLSRDPQQAWRTELGWLHVVSGPDAVRVAHAVDALAAAFVGRGERVLAVDAGRDLDLHERFGGDVRWGLDECLAGGVPLLGAVQAAGRPGFYLLGRGASGSGGRWEAVSGLLEEARRHFDRVILAFGAGVPNSAALPLGGRVLEAWWAEPGPELPRRAVALSDRLGIAFAGLDAAWLAQLACRDAAPASAESAAEPAEAVALAEAEAVPVEVADRVAAAPQEPAVVVPCPSPEPPPVLECDPDVRDRLRFLMWMRRVRAERRSTPVGAGTGD